MSDQTPSHGDLTKLMLFFGKIPETHVKSMEQYPFIFFNYVTKVEIEYNIATSKESNSLVSYSLTLSKENGNLPNRFNALEAAIRALFWKEVKIQVKINGEEVYKSE